MSDLEQINEDIALAVPTGQDMASRLASAKEAAGLLRQFIVDNNLSVTIQGKEYANVDAWEFCGFLFGMTPVVAWTNEHEWGFEARVEVMQDGRVVLAGEMECRNDERHWRNAESYALRSMAQTRATSKAYRLGLSWIMKLAGYQVTPAEEVPAEGFPNPPAAETDEVCPACLVVNGEKVEVWHNDKKPFWKCKNQAGDCAGTSSDGKWAWSGWHEHYETSANEWLRDNGYPPLNDSVHRATPGQQPASVYLADELTELCTEHELDRRQVAKFVPRAIQDAALAGDITLPDIEPEPDWTEIRLSQEYAKHFTHADAEVVAGHLIEVLIAEGLME